MTNMQIPVRLRGKSCVNQLSKLFLMLVQQFFGIYLGIHVSTN
jgi:hypothetical protein